MTRISRPGVGALLSTARNCVDLTCPVPAWHAAADANHAHQNRCRSSGGSTARRLAADFLIGAHALHRADALYTRNPGDFADFPGLTLMVPV